MVTGSSTTWGEFEAEDEVEEDEDIDDVNDKSDGNLIGDKVFVWFFMLRCKNLRDSDAFSCSKTWLFTGNRSMSRIKWGLNWRKSGWE